ARPLRGFGRRNARIETHAAQTYEAEGLTRHIDLPRRLPESYGEPNANRCPGTNADRAGRILDILLPQARHGCRANRDRQHARPANVGDRIGELAGTRLRTDRLAERDRDKKEQGPYHSMPHRDYHLISSIRRRKPSWDTIAGTCVMPNLVVSAPC